MKKIRVLGNIEISNVSSIGLLLSRLGTGTVWLAQLFWKLPPRFGCPADFAVTTGFNTRTSGLCDWVGIMTLYSRLPLQASLVKRFVVPNLSWVGWIIFLMEAFVAASLILGAFTRLGGLAGLLQAVNLYIGVSAFPGEWPWSYILLAITGFFFMAVPAGRIWGLDVGLQPYFHARAERGKKLSKVFEILT